MKLIDLGPSKDNRLRYALGTVSMAVSGARTIIIERMSWEVRWGGSMYKRSLNYIQLESIDDIITVQEADLVVYD